MNLDPAAIIWEYLLAAAADASSVRGGINRDVAGLLLYGKQKETRFQLPKTTDKIGEIV